MEQENNIMLDLETMGNGSNAAIVAIGAVKFNPDTHEIIDHMYSTVDLQSSVDAGLDMDASTVLWWMQQSQDARQELYIDNRPPLGTALNHFCKFAGENPIIWGNGSDFDNAILANAYRKLGMQPPWKFWNNRCYRTIKNMSSVKLQRTGTHHNALDDAIYQANHLMAILNH